MILNIKVPNFQRKNKDYIRNALIEKLERVIRLRETNRNGFGIGSIIKLLFKNIQVMFNVFIGNSMNIVAAIDGTKFFWSNKKSCPECLKNTKGDKTHSFHRGAVMSTVGNGPKSFRQKAVSLDDEHRINIIADLGEWGPWLTAVDG
ncbi:hypothetical protein ACPUYX_11410 [Desulfosporosinus sp. SYSU MS00001]|uniref:hypothetical protein n=1 Tax=Desulfosporosinus sp. SYSU MS00001 TaxID=3416284 RepID=UPI003CEA2373